MLFLLQLGWELEPKLGEYHERVVKPTVTPKSHLFDAQTFRWQRVCFIDWLYYLRVGRRPMSRSE